MAEPQGLIPDTNIDEVIETVEVVELVFKDEEGKSIRYNRLAVNLTNGERMLLRLDPESKAILRITLRGLAK